MLNKLKNNHEGFTIIEVIIVLVIGAVIMLAVFLVVPQLQRSQRNTRRQNDARQVLSAVQQYQSNNSGSYPGTVSGVTAQQAIEGITGGVIKNPNGDTYVISTSTPSNPPDTKTIYIVKGATCVNNQANGNTGGGFVVVTYVEGAAPNSYCVGS